MMPRKLSELTTEELRRAQIVADSPGHYLLKLPNAFGVEVWDLGPSERQLTLGRLTGRSPEDFIP